MIEMHRVPAGSLGGWKAAISPGTGVNWDWLPSRSLLLQPSLALRNLEPTCKPGKLLGSRNTLAAGTSCLLILPSSPDRNQLLDTLQGFFWDDWCLQWIPSPLPPSPRRKVLLPAGAHRPHAPLSWAVFEVRQSCAWLVGVGSWRGGAGAAGIHAAPWDYSFSFSSLKRSYAHFYFTMYAVSWL